MSFLSKAKRNIPPVKQVKLKLVHIDFWSAIKAGLLVTVATGVATLVAFFLIWLLVSQTGLFGSLSTLVNSVVGGTSSAEGVDVAQSLSLPRVMSFAFTLSLFNIVLGTALVGIYTAIFNVIGRLTGGISIGFTNN